MSASISLIAFLALIIVATTSAQRLQNPMRQNQCFACVSGTLSDQSRVMFDRNGQQGPQQQTYDPCDDPFQQGNTLLQPCQTSCVKSVTENQFTRVVMRGCLSDVAQQLTGRNPNLIIPAPGSCTENTITTGNVGQVKTRTCVCDGVGCNGSAAMKFSFVAFIVSLLSYLTMM